MDGSDIAACAGAGDIEVAAVAAEAAAALAVADDGTSLIKLWPAGCCVGAGCFGRTFLMPCHRTKPTGDFSLDGLTNDRVDLIARCITAAFHISFGIRKNTDLRLPMTTRGGAITRTVHINGASVTHLRPDERGLSALLQRRLADVATYGHGEVHNKKRRPPKLKPTPEQRIAAAQKEARAMECLEGIAVLNQGFKETVLGCLTNTLSGPPVSSNPPPGPPRLVLILDEEGAVIDDPDAGWQPHVAGGVTVVLGDNRGLNPDEEAVLAELEARGFAKLVKVSLGPIPLLASQCIVLVHHYLDRVAHTCTVKNGTTSSPEYPRGSQCKPAEEYKGWMKGAEEKKGATT